jgi:hypothetical protein
LDKKDSAKLAAAVGSAVLAAGGIKSLHDAANNGRELEFAAKRKLELAKIRAK